MHDIYCPDNSSLFNFTLNVCFHDIIVLKGGAAGAVDEESFISSFEDCKKVN